MENEIIPEQEQHDFLGSDKLQVSESENDEENLDRALNVSKLNDSESEADADATGLQINSDSDVNTNTLRTIKLKKRKQKRLILNSDDDEDAAHNKLFEKPAKISALIDSDSSEQTEPELDKKNDLSDAEDLEQDTHTIQSSKKQHKTQRVSAKKALDDIMHIQSEQQRLHREVHISIPYHKPKRYSLQDFLKRHTIIRPQTPEQKTEGAIAALLSSKSPKMTIEQLEAYAKLMDERAKEAAEFFKSDSVTEEMQTTAVEHAETEEQADELQAAAVNLENMENQQEQQPEQHQPEETVENINMLETMQEDATVNVAVERSDKDNFAIVTEVLELPRLDLNKMNICMDVPRTTTNVTIPHATKKADNIRCSLTAQQLGESPSIKGTPNMLIDLDSGDIVVKPTSGIDKLLQRLMSTRKTRKTCAPEAVSILSTINGKLEMSNVKLNLAQQNTEAESKEHKPGAAYVKLKQDLKSIITKKRLTELQKRHEEKEETENITFSDEEDELEQYDEIIDEEENPIDEEIDQEIDEAQEDKNSENENFNDFEDIIEEEIEEEDYSDNDNIDDEIEETDLLNTSSNSKQKNRIVQAFVHDSDDDDDVDLLKSQTQRRTLTAEEFNMSIDLDTSTTNAHSASALISQIPMTQAVPDENELIALCSGTFADNDCMTLTGAVEKQDQQFTEHTISTQMARQIFCSDDDAADESEATLPTNKVKKLTKKRVKQRVLSISDDENEDFNTTTIRSELEDEVEEEEISEKEDYELEELEQEDVEAAAENFIDYDSEENEVIVQMTKKDCRLKAADFVEKEAELSESEWGSEDEDEKNMDAYDIELGDEDEFDRDKLRHELEKIHARKMLDEDIRDVRKLQELFFEDEEQDGVGRQRQFKWKNAQGGFSLDESRNGDAEKLAGAASDDDEAIENNWRKIRFEREQLLHEERFKLAIDDRDDLNNLLEANLITRKIESNSIPKNATIKPQNGLSRFLIPKATSTLHKKTVRGSFLGHDQETLLKISGLKKNINSITIEDEDEEALTTVAATTNKQSKNFVFATLTAAEHENLKRKSKFLQSGSDEINSDAIKRRKINTKENKCFIDQLL